MSENEAPAVAEVADTSLPEVVADAPAPEAEAPQTPAELSHNRRLIEAAKAERRAVAAQRAAEQARREAQSQQSQMAALQKQYAEMQAQMRAVEEARSGAKKKPRNLIEQHGLTLDDVVRDYLGEEQTPQALMAELEDRARGETAAVKAQVEALKKELEDRDRRAQEADAGRAMQALRQEIDSVVQSDPDKYELTVALGQQGEVYELMRLAYQKNGTVLPVDRAAEMIEDFLFDQAKQTVKAKKLARLFQPQEHNAAPPSAGKPAPQAKQAPDAREPKASTTLTAQLATSPAQPGSDLEDLDKDAAIARAVKKIEAVKAAKRAAAK